MKLLGFWKTYLRSHKVFQFINNMSWFISIYVYKMNIRWLRSFEWLRWHVSRTPDTLESTQHHRITFNLDQILPSNLFKKMQNKWFQLVYIHVVQHHFKWSILHKFTKERKKIFNILGCTSCRYLQIIMLLGFLWKSSTIF